MTLMRTGLPVFSGPPTRRVLLSDMSWKTVVSSLSVLRLMVTGMMTTLFQSAEVLPAALRAARVRMSEPMLLKM